MSEEKDTKNGTALAAQTVQVAAQSGAAISLHPIVAAVLANSPNIETLREIMALQKEWDAENARKAFVAALAALKAELPTVVNKDKTVDFTGKSGIRTHYTHSSLAAVMDAVTGPLAKHGFSLSWEPSTSQASVTVICRLTHVAGHSMTSTLTAPRDDSGNKSQAQGVASTITLLSRYTAMALLGLASADMSEPPGPDHPDAGPRERSPEEQAASKLKEEIMHAMAGAKTMEALNTQAERAKQLPESLKPPVKSLWKKRANELQATNRPSESA